MVKLEVVAASDGTLENYFSDLLQSPTIDNAGKIIPASDNLSVVDTAQSSSESSPSAHDSDVIRLVQKPKHFSEDAHDNLSGSVNSHIAVMLSLLSLFEFIGWSGEHTFTFKSMDVFVFKDNRKKPFENTRIKTPVSGNLIAVTDPIIVDEDAGLSVGRGEEKLKSSGSELLIIKNDKPCTVLSQKVNSRIDINASLPTYLKTSESNVNVNVPQKKPKLQLKGKFILPEHYDQATVDLADRNKKLQKLLNDSTLQSDLSIDVTTSINTEASVTTQQRIATDLAEKEKFTEPTQLNDTVRSIDVTQPAWLAEEMDILLFRINGLQLGLPLLSLGKVQMLDKNLTSLFGQVEWILGLMPNKKGTTRVIDTSKFLNLTLPGIENNSDDSHRQRYLISLEENKWGLAVDKIEESVRIPKHSIKWRPKRLTMPWFAGTLNDRMCTLLDPTELQIALSNYIQEKSN